MARKKGKRSPVKNVVSAIRSIEVVSGRGRHFASSQKGGGIIAMESLGEKAFSRVAAIDPRVRAIFAQPLTIDVVTGEFLETKEALAAARALRPAGSVKVREYTPDFKLILVDGRIVFVEVKDETATYDEGYERKLEAASRLCRQRGYLFMVVFLPKQACSPLLHNANLLSRAYMRIEDLTAEGVMPDAFDPEVGAEPLTLSKVAEMVGLPFRDSFTLLAAGLIGADLAQEVLGPRTEVWPAYGELTHLELIPLGDIES